MTSIGIIGVGAIGGSLSGFMALHGEDVTFIDPWRENVEAMRQSGLLLDGSVEGRVTDMAVHHTDELGELPEDTRFDVLIVAVKSYDTRWATTTMLPFITDETWIVSPQNGINELQIAPIVGAERTVGCVTTISAGMMEPAHITRTDSMAQALQTEPLCFSVGELDGRVTDRVERLAELFAPAGRTVVTEDLWGERWTKLSTNCMANPISAMTGLPSYDMRANDEARVTMFRLAAEAVRVGRAMGYHVKAPIGGFTLEDLERAAVNGHPALEEKFVGKPQKIVGRPSMAQDVIKGRPTEIDYLNGFVVEQGLRIGVPTPYNSAATALVKGIEAGEFDVGLENLARVESMARVG
jgi:2-dehydropantoate 2-reductase